MGSPLEIIAILLQSMRRLSMDMRTFACRKPEFAGYRDDQANTGPAPLPFPVIRPHFLHSMRVPLWLRCLASLCQVDGWARVAAKAKIYVVPATAGYSTPWTCC